MQVSTAIELVHGLIFFPGFEFKATDHTNRFEGSIKVRIEYDAWNTNRETVVDGHFTEKIRTYAEFPLMVEDISIDAFLYRRLIAALLHLNEHEAREAMRVKGTLWAPFHPHKMGGMQRWLQTSGDAETMWGLMPDFHFGVC